VRTILKSAAKAVLHGVLTLTVLIGIRIVLGVAIGEDPYDPKAVDRELLQHASQIHRDALVFDGHNDLPTWMLDYGFELDMSGDDPDDRSPLIYEIGVVARWGNPPRADQVRTHTDLARIRAGGLDAQFFSIWPACTYAEPDSPISARQRAHDMIESFQSQVRRHPEDVEMAFGADEVERIVSEGKMAALMGLEGGHAIEESLENLRLFYELGIRYMTLTHSCSLSWADSSTNDPIAGGLSEFGVEVVGEMNRLGMIVDVSHVSDATFWDVVAVTSAPIMASHSSARAIADHPRNMADDMLRAVADNGGVVMINFATSYLDPAKTSFLKTGLGWHWFWHPRRPDTPLTILVDHIDHVGKVAGIDHVGLGSDFDGVPFLPEGMADVADLPNITVELLRRGYSEEDIGKVLGGNALRVLRAVEELADWPSPRVSSTSDLKHRSKALCFPTSPLERGQAATCRSSIPSEDPRPVPSPEGGGSE